MPKLGLRIEVDEVFTHCSKAFLRAQLWDPETFVDRSRAPELRRDPPQPEPGRSTRSGTTRSARSGTRAEKASTRSHGPRSSRARRSYAAVSPHEAYDAVRDAFVAHHRGEWTMQPKVYVTNYPAGDFRAMPALGGGHALLKWVTSFPGNPARGLPTVTGLVLLSNADTGAARGGARRGRRDRAAHRRRRRARRSTRSPASRASRRGRRLRRQRRRDGAHARRARCLAARLGRGRDPPDHRRPGRSAPGSPGRSRRHSPATP